MDSSSNLCGLFLRLFVLVVLCCTGAIHCVPVPQTTQEPIETKICQSCELYCMTKHNAFSDVCNECQCEPPKDVIFPNKHYCFFRKCEQECDKGYQLDVNGCPTCDCVA
uniref:Antistasin-like n=1 Tax=Crassostrea virginica TaxID=6565 RepID=A0A8B8DR46_CRAVI|nr:antistasin-like [Crassostrea virginica]